MKLHYKENKQKKDKKQTKTLTNSTHEKEPCCCFTLPAFKGRLYNPSCLVSPIPLLYSNSPKPEMSLCLLSKTQM